MKYEVVALKEKRIIGFCERTGNEQKDMANVIGTLWKKLGEIECVENGKYKKCVGLYTDYEGMNYDVTVGYEVEKDSLLNQGMIEKKIPAGKYAKFVLHGDVVKTVQEAWQEIWKMDLERTFVADFEEYQQGNDMNNMEIHIYVSIK